MRDITPVSIWINGQYENANIFDLTLVNDDLETRAQFYFRLGFQTENEQGDKQSTWLTDGNLTLSGAKYVAWDNEPSVNDWAYNWAADQLNIILI